MCYLDNVGRGENSSEWALGHLGYGERGRLGWLDSVKKRNTIVFYFSPINMANGGKTTQIGLSRHFLAKTRLQVRLLRFIMSYLRMLQWWRVRVKCDIYQTVMYPTIMYPIVISPTVMYSIVMYQILKYPTVMYPTVICPTAMYSTALYLYKGLCVHE